MSTLLAVLIGGFALTSTAPNLQYFQRGKASGANILTVITRKPTVNEAMEPTDSQQ